MGIRNWEFSPRYEAPPRDAYGGGSASHPGTEKLEGRQKPSGACVPKQSLGTRTKNAKIPLGCSIPHFLVMQTYSGNSIMMKNLYHGKSVERTDHPHIVKVQGVGSGEPVILGTHIMVRTVVEQYQLGNSTEDILWDFPQLSSAQIHDALSYYHDHREEMDRFLEQASYEYWQPIIERMIYERTENRSGRMRKNLIPCQNC